MTKRDRIVCLILAAMFTVLIEVITIEVIKYNLFFLIVCGFLYFTNCVFIVLNIYCALTKGFVKYHSYVTIRDIAVLGLQLVVYYFLGNIRGIGIKQLIVVVVLALVFSYITTKFNKQARKICPYVFIE